MLTDIFADRYSTTKLWITFGDPERRLLVQAFRILAEQICPYWVDGKESARGKAFWTDLHSRLSMELGLKSLGPLAYSYQAPYQGKAHTYTGTWTINIVCEQWMLKEFDDSIPADRFIKERLSLVELGFRMRGEEIQAANAELPTKIEATKKRIRTYSGVQLPGDPTDGLRAMNVRINAVFQSAINELNARFRQAGCNLNYHNGFIQIASDSLIAEEIETPFWALVANPIWGNVDTDMKEALDRRDANARDPAFYAARALESTLKIASDEKGSTRGNEKGAHNYIDNLASKRAALIANWEAEALKSFFTKVRNPLGHGPGNKPMPKLGEQQTDWAIETCMVWIKSIIRRL